MIHRFDQKLRQGKKGEYILDMYFSTWYIIYIVELDIEMPFGIDRIFINKKTGQTFSVEYKADFTGRTTVFVETISNNNTHSPGWAIKCVARVLCYYHVRHGRVYDIDPEVVREQLPRWRRAYPPASSSNEGYTTFGVSVPTDEFQRFCYKKLAIELETA